MSRSNGPGGPPNGWPADYRPDAVDPYQDPYYAQQPRQPAPHPQQGVPQSRAPRIQQPAPSRSPQTGLPPNLSPAAPQQAPAYAQPYGNAPQQPPQQGYAQPYAQQTAVPQYSQPPQYAPQAAPQGYAPQPAPRTQSPVRTQPPAQTYQPPEQHQPTSHADARLAAYPTGYDAPQTGRPAQVAPASYPPAYTPAPAPLAYVPETTQRPSQQPQQRAPQQPHQNPPSYDKWQIPPQGQPAHGQSPYGQPQSQPQIDPHGYDLGNYLPSPSQPDPRTQRPTAPPAAWPQQHGDDGRQNAPGASFPPQYPSGLQASSQALEPVHDDEYDEHEDDEDYEEAPRKTRYGLIAASLIAAIAMGGGLAYAYKMFVAPRAQLASTQVVKNSASPVKVKPSDPGGTKFANADSKMMEQLSGSTDGSSDGGPKAVRTMTIERDGSVQNGAPPSSSPLSAIAPQQQQASPAVLPRAASVPGLMIDGIPPPRQQAPAQSPAPQTAPPAQQAARPAPKIIAAAPPAAAYPDDPQTADASALPAASAPPAAKKVPPKKVAVAGGPTVAPSAVGGPKGANGFVAVLASVPASGSSRNQAMQQFADLQQKFSGILGSKAPDIVEAKLPNGVYHRLVVGPPASRDSATSVCTQLKASGYTADCWVTAF